MKFDIKSRWNNSIIFTAEIEATEDMPPSLRLGLAIKAAWKVRANLGGAYLRGADLRGANLEGANLEGADLRGAYLRGADLRGLILLPARATRSDGYEYFAWTSILGGMVIRAGCREWVGEDAIEQARRHCETETSPICRAEALRIVAHIEAAWNERSAHLVLA